MVSPQKYYIQEISKKTNLRANWLPDKQMNVGDIGKIEDGIFTLYTTLTHQGFPVKLSESAAGLATDYSSVDAIRISEKPDVDILSPVAKGKKICTIEFLRPEGVLFHIKDSVKITLANLNELENRILEKYKKSIWNLGWVIVTEIIRSNSGTVIINSGASNTLEFELSGGANFDSLNLAENDLNLRLISESGTSIKFIGASNITPLFTIKGISDPLFGKTKFRGANAYRAIQFDALRDLPFNPSEIE